MPSDEPLLQQALRMQGKALELHGAILEAQHDRLAAQEIRMHELQQAIQLLTTLVAQHQQRLGSLLETLRLAVAESRTGDPDAPHKAPGPL